MNRIGVFISKRWKLLTLLAFVASTGFVGGVAANRVIVTGVQPLAATHLFVPRPAIIIHTVTWDINATSQTLNGLVLNVTARPGSTYTIIVSVSCVNLTTGVVFWCAHGKVTVTPPAGGPTPLVSIPIVPNFDPELVEVHDLSFIVTSSPPQPPCTNPNCAPP